MIECGVDFDSLPAYPKVMRNFGFGTTQGKVFMIMPFEAPHSNDLWSAVQKVCKKRGLNLVKGDSSNHPRLILNEVLYHLETAEIIIADLTECSPNVLYELGIAHTRLDCKSVIILCQEDVTKKIPFNVSGCSYIKFNKINQESGRKKLKQDLNGILDELKNKTAPTIFNSSLERTQKIVSDLQGLLEYKIKGSSKQTVWFSGGLSAFSISDEEYYPEAEEYMNALKQERELMLDLARAGCSMKCIINTAPVSKTEKDNFIYKRIEHLLAFLESKKQEDLQALENIEWVISPYRQINLYIIGNISFFEGYKEDEGRGFGLTLRQTGFEAINAKVSVQKALFDALKKSTLDKYGGDGDLKNAIKVYLKGNLIENN